MSSASLSVFVSLKTSHPTIDFHVVQHQKRQTPAICSNVYPLLPPSNLPPSPQLLSQSTPIPKLIPKFTQIVAVGRLSLIIFAYFVLVLCVWAGSRRLSIARIVAWNLVSRIGKWTKKEKYIRQLPRKRVPGRGRYKIFFLSR
jgi:hypothetical protein